jgi:inosine triphosphate pyrophosphatase
LGFRLSHRIRSTHSSHHFAGLNNLLMAYDDKSAYALCVFSFAIGPNSEPITFSGKTLVSF